MTLTLYEHPFAAYCWKPLIALRDRDVTCERRQVADERDRARLAELWPTASIPVLVDDEAGVTLGESTIVVDYLDRFGEAPPLIAAEPATALRVRLWDRLMDGAVATPMQKIVADALRPEGCGDTFGVDEARRALAGIYPVLDRQLTSQPWLAGNDFSLADCAAAPALFYARVVHDWDEDRLPHLTRYYKALVARPSVARTIEDARPFRELFPLPWPDHVDLPL
jgi:glutathione S-transferase